MIAPEETAALLGRALIEQGDPVAGSMSLAAATVVFEPSAALVQISGSVAACLRTAATEAAALSVPREQVRAGAVLAFTVEYAATQHRAGRPARDDGWFAARSGSRAAADDIAEAVVATARRSTDERRIRHLGYLLAEVSCSSELDTEVARRALRLAEDLSWRQFALLAGVGRRDRVPLPMAPLHDDPRGWSEWAAREDVADLQLAGLLDPPVAVFRPGATLPRLRAADLRLTRRGVLLHRVLALDLLHEDAVTAALAALGLPRS